MAVVVVDEVEVEVGVGGAVVVMVVKDGGLQPLGFPAETALWQLVDGCQWWVGRIECLPREEEGGDPGEQHL
jgi:hypothetical protein